MLELFTIEEVNLMCIFDINSRGNIINELSAAMSDFAESELVEIAESVLAKLNSISDDEFAALDFYPNYDDYEEV